MKELSLARRMSFRGTTTPQAPGGLGRMLVHGLAVNRPPPGAERPGWHPASSAGTLQVAQTTSAYNYGSTPWACSYSEELGRARGSRKETLGDSG